MPSGVSVLSCGCSGAVVLVIQASVSCGCAGSACGCFKRAFHANDLCGVPAVLLRCCRASNQAFVSSRCCAAVPVVPVLLFRLFRRCRTSVSYGCFMQVVCYCKYCAIGGAGVACACATAIAIGFPPSEKMAKWKLDKSFQNDKTRA